MVNNPRGNPIVKIDLDSAYYPESLREIKNKPRQLYCCGDLSLLSSRCMGIVGSRKYTVYGKQVARMVGRRLAENGVTIVSGLAAGIDTFAHEGTLEAEGKAIAVLGTGINRMYPVKNQELMEKICRTGLVISEYEPDFQGRKESFPARNRIIAGLSEGLVVIEANFKSGSLITAEFAMEQNKTIYAVPGNINSQFSMGTNLLIRDGATPLVVIDDILHDMRISPRIIKDEDNNSYGKDEIEALRVLSRCNGMSVDALAKELQRRVPEVNSLVTILEIKGAVFLYAGKIHLAK